MTLTLMCVVTLTVTCLVTGGQSVGLTASPMEIVPKHTKTLTLNCSHNKPETTAILKIEIRKVVDTKQQQQQVPPQQMLPRQQQLQPPLLPPRPPVGMGAGGAQMLGGAGAGSLLQQYGNQGMVGGAAGYGGRVPQVPRSALQGMAGGNAQHLLTPQQQQSQQMGGGGGGGYNKQASFTKNGGGGGSSATGGSAYSGVNNVQYRKFNDVKNTQTLGSYYRLKRESLDPSGRFNEYEQGHLDRRRRESPPQSGAEEPGLLGVLTRRKRAMPRREPRRIRKRSVPYSHHRVSREQRSLSTATLGGGNLVHFVPTNNRFEGQGRMASPAYLAVEIASPEEGDSGRYVCTITHMGSKGQIKDEFAVDVTATDTGSLEAIESRVSRLEGQLPAMSAMGQRMQKLVEEDTERSKELQKEIEKLKKENQDLVAIVDELKEKFKVVSDRTTALMEDQSATKEAAVAAASEAASAAASAAAVADAMSKQQQKQQQSSDSQSQNAAPQKITPTVSSSGEKEKEKKAENSTNDATSSEDGQQNGGKITSSQQNGGKSDTAGNKMNGQNPPYQNGAGYQNTNINNMYGRFPVPNPAMGQWGNPMPQQGPWGYNGFYQNRAFGGYGGYGQQPMPQQQQQPQQQPQQQQPQQQQQQHQQQPQQQQQQQQQQPMANGQFPPVPRPQPGFYGMGFPPPQPGAFGPYANPYGYRQPQGQINPPHLKSDDLTEITARMDDLENTRISALENELKDVKLKWVQPMSQTLDGVEVYANVTLRAAVEQLQEIDFEGLIHRVNDLETEVIPTLVYNLTIAERDIALLRQTLDIIRGREKVPNEKVAKLLGQVEMDEYVIGLGDEDEDDDDDDDVKKEEEEEKNQTPPLLLSTANMFGVAKAKQKKDAGHEEPVTPSETPAKTSTTHEATTLASTSDGRRSCYVCGNNDTLENCTPKTQDGQEKCRGPGEMYCMTDVYENGRARDIYKRCVTEQECHEKQKGNPKLCATSSFLVPEVMECHYCCTTDNCNSSIRPDKDLYQG